MENQKLRMVNLMGYTLRLFSNHSKTFLTLPSDGKVRTSIRRRINKTINGVAVVEMDRLLVGKLPKPKSGTIYLVPSTVLALAKDRNDLFSPYRKMGLIVENENSQHDNSLTPEVWVEGYSALRSNYN